ncbi:class E sortase [Streptomyces sp. TR02-1]|uniref:class E sortase n=1 Tax=Streptomyces sp. TR02-1 TaxID=3385977 RepID=UPI00399FA05A
MAGTAPQERVGTGGRTEGEDPRPPGGDTPGEPAGRRRGRGRRVVRGIAAAVGVLGELLITAGLVLGLFVVYSLWWTNVVADRQAQQQGAEVRERWAAGQDRSGPQESGPGERNLRNGVGFLHVPAMSEDDILVTRGTSTDHLNRGVAGYYTDPVRATLPWDGKGNFSLAAHRDGHGARFHNIHELRTGDAIVFETEFTWYVYRVYAVLPETSKYDVDVLADVPEESGRKRAGRYVTLTTCTPMYTSEHRYIVWGELDRTVPVDHDRTPPKELR